MTTNGSKKPLDKIIADFNAKVQSIAANTSNNDGMDPITKDHLLFGKTHLLYGDPDRDYKEGMEQNTRKYYLSLHKTAKDLIRHNVMSSRDVAKEDKTEEFIDEVMNTFVEYCKKLYLDYEEHERATHKTVVSYKDIKYINTQTGKIEKRWDLYMNDLPVI